MPRSLFIAFCGLAGFCWLIAGDRQVGAAEPPNIVVILADDLGYGDVQCYNPQQGKVPTPHIDRLATQGMRFTDAHSSSGVCSPSRYALLTGRCRWRTRLQAGIVDAWKTLVADRLTIGGLARRHDYRTACIGKWHLGSDWPISAAQRPFFAEAGAKAEEVTDASREAWRSVFSQPIPGGPTTRRFDCRDRRAELAAVLPSRTTGLSRIQCVPAERETAPADREQTGPRPSRLAIRNRSCPPWPTRRVRSSKRPPRRRNGSCYTCR